MHSNASSFSYPFLMMMGSNDRMVCNKGALKLFNNSKKVTEKEKIMFDGFGHELHKEPGRHQVYKQVLLYLSRRISNKNVVLWKKPATLKQGLLGQGKPCLFQRFVKILILLYLLVGLM